MEYSSLNSAFYNINDPTSNIQNEINYGVNNQVNDDMYYKSINDGTRFGETKNEENLIPSYTGGINTCEEFTDNGIYYGSPNANEEINKKENFDPYWNGQVIRNNIATNVNERFTNEQTSCCISCKRNTFLLYLVIIMLIIMYFKK